MNNNNKQNLELSNESKKQAIIIKNPATHPRTIPGLRNAASGNHLKPCTSFAST
jgi:hypothetical protein